MDEGYRRYGVTAELAAVIAEGAFYDLDAPVTRLGAMHVPDSVLAAARGRDRADRRDASRTTARELCGYLRRGADEMATQNLRHDGGRLGAADRFRAAAHASAWRAPRSCSSKSEMGALLCFDMNNVRYITATHIGTWAQDKISRFTLLPQDDEPILWDFGSAARHHQLNCPWLGRAVARRHLDAARRDGAEMGRAETSREKIRIELEKRGLHNEPLGVDVVELPVLFALQEEGITVVDGQAADAGRPR